MKAEQLSAGCGEAAREKPQGKKAAGTASEGRAGAA